MQGKVVVITGATSGVGRAAAEEFARRGARLVIVGRDAGRVADTLAALQAAGPNQSHRAVLGELSLLADMKRIGADIAASEPVIDVLANNAGAVFMRRQETADGLECTFALNHMAYFVVTNALLPALKAAKNGRVVSTTSIAYGIAPLDFSDLQSTRKYSAFIAYSRSKLCNVLFTQELARRLSDTAVTANCFHPGFVASRFAENAVKGADAAMRFATPFLTSPEKAAETLLYLATAPELTKVSGRYFVRKREVKPYPVARNDAAAARLWEVSEAISAGRFAP